MAKADLRSYPFRLSLNPNFMKNKNELPAELQLGEAAAKGICTELTARMILGGPEDDYKKGFNEAMQWARRLVTRYENGDGLFQLPTKEAA